jgi:molybdenum cofactor synthesis domain-containing protein
MMTKQDQPKAVTAAMLVVGDEILSGRTKDKNIGTVADFCADLSIDLNEARIVADEIDEIVAAINALRAKYDYVFTSGGIGPTHDDITADAVAKAFGVELNVDQRAIDAMQARFVDYEMTEGRLRMARIPEGGELIDNPVSGAPGIQIENVFVMAGVPKILQAMLESIAPTLKTGVPQYSVFVNSQVGEGVLSAPLAALQSSYQTVKIGSYPQLGSKDYMTQIVMRSSDEKILEQVRHEAQAIVDDLFEKAKKGQGPTI